MNLFVLGGIILIGLLIVLTVKNFLQAKVEEASHHESTEKASKISRNEVLERLNEMDLEKKDYKDIYKAFDVQGYRKNRSIPALRNHLLTQMKDDLESLDEYLAEMYTEEDDEEEETPVEGKKVQKSINIKNLLLPVILISTGILSAMNYNYAMYHGRNGGIAALGIPLIISILLGSTLIKKFPMRLVVYFILTVICFVLVAIPLSEDRKKLFIGLVEKYPQNAKQFAAILLRPYDLFPKLTPENLRPYVEILLTGYEDENDIEYISALYRRSSEGDKNAQKELIKRIVQNVDPVSTRAIVEAPKEEKPTSGFRPERPFEGSQVEEPTKPTSGGLKTIVPEIATVDCSKIGMIPVAFGNHSEPIFTETAATCAEANLHAVGKTLLYLFGKRQIAVEGANLVTRSLLWDYPQLLRYPTLDEVVFLEAESCVTTGELLPMAIDLQDLRKKISTCLKLYRPSY